MVTCVTWDVPFRKSVLWGTCWRDECPIGWPKTQRSPHPQGAHQQHDQFPVARAWATRLLIGKLKSLVSWKDNSHRPELFKEEAKQCSHSRQRPRRPTESLKVIHRATFWAIVAWGLSHWKWASPSRGPCVSSGCPLMETLLKKVAVYHHLNTQNFFSESPKAWRPKTRGLAML